VNTYEFIKEHYPDALQHIVQSQTQPSNINLGSLQISKNSLFLTSMIKDGHYTAFNIAWKLCEQAKICTPNSDKTLLDACANVGGNTLWFAQYFNQVTACEMNRKEFERLEQNMVHTYGLQHVNVVNDTCLNVITQPNQRWNVIFFDPPWGGQYYKYVQKLILALDEEDIGSIIEYCFKFDKCDMIILKHPSNWFTTVVNKKFHTFTFIKQVLEQERLKIEETLYIESFNSTELYNKAHPIYGVLGVNHSEEAKIKMSVSKKGLPMHQNTKEALIKANKSRTYVLGRKHTRESVEKRAEKFWKPIMQYSLDGIFIKEFPSIKAVALENPAWKPSSVSMCA
ncbi:hypothetical protein EBU94_09690, partial [bacterium]|nr:hypothetical protein [bacterium]